VVTREPLFATSAHVDACRGSGSTVGSRMGQNFVARDRGQAFLLTASLMDWLPED